MSDIFQEIDEELRRENFAKLWQRYGIYVIALAVVVVLATGGVVAWRQYQSKQRQAEGARYTLALDLARQGKDKDAAEVFGEITRQAGAGRAMLARFETAALKAKSGDVKDAIGQYQALAADTAIDPVYRGLATLLWAQYQLRDGDPKAIIEALVPLTGYENPWHPSALELTALAQIKAGNKEEALAIYQRLAEDPGAPRGARARAAEIAGTRAASAPVPEITVERRLGQ
ncbi:MAG TPA: tetratricopeptide repeat protein [Stellaceae bacterium]|nr:tetratricopeptide repeat protein [Stellaceae bacterium]